MEVGLTTSKLYGHLPDMATDYVLPIVVGSFPKRAVDCKAPFQCTETGLLLFCYETRIILDPLS